MGSEGLLFDGGRDRRSLAAEPASMNFSIGGSGSDNHDAHGGGQIVCLRRYSIEVLGLDRAAHLLQRPAFTAILTAEGAFAYPLLAGTCVRGLFNFCGCVHLARPLAVRAVDTIHADVARAWDCHGAHQRTLVQRRLRLGTPPPVN
eukprot:311846-Prymnesium_polylepis.1